MEAAYLEHAKWQPYPERIFEWAVQAVLNDTRSATALARREDRQDWAEIDAQCTRASEPPSTVPENVG